jgi:hypothetical protein
MYKTRGNVLRTSNWEIELRPPGFTLGSETSSHWSEAFDKLSAKPQNNMTSVKAVALFHMEGNGCGEITSKKKNATFNIQYPHTAIRVSSNIARI